MRYREIVCEDVATSDLLDFWGLVEHFKVRAASENIHDQTIPWINYNDWRRIDKLITNKNMRLSSKIKLFTDLSDVQNYSKPFATPEMFLAALKQPVTLWRGGGGVYDPAHAYSHGWTSFTTKEGRAQTFSKYDGTRAMRAFKLPLRDQYWIVKLTIPLDNILLYLPHGSDAEVIISAADAAHAEVVVQTEKGMANAVD